jgi:predicted nucleic acid-binding protein
MILIDTSIWVDHLGKPDARLTDLLKNEDVYGHPHVIGELALGNLRQFDVVIRFMNKLPKPTMASDSEVLLLIREKRLHGTGVGYSDAHLLASALLTPAAVIWTRDKRLNAVALRLGVAWTN